MARDIRIIDEIQIAGRCVGVVEKKGYLQLCLG